MTTQILHYSNKQQPNAFGGNLFTQQQWIESTPAISSGGGICPRCNWINLGSGCSKCSGLVGNSGGLFGGGNVQTNGGLFGGGENVQTNGGLFGVPLSSLTGGGPPGWKNRNQRLQMGQTVLLYHQTDKNTWEAIIKSGYKMKRGSAGMAGGAIYFATTAQSTNQKAHRRGIILKCKVKLGVTHTTHPNGNQFINFTKLNKAGFDSVLIPRPSGSEYAIYNWDQVEIISAQDSNSRKLVWKKSKGNSAYTEYPTNYYAILGIRKNSSLAEIRSAFHRIAKKCHPDHNQQFESTKAASSVWFQQVKKAYDVLIDPIKKQQYDKINS